MEITASILTNMACVMPPVEDVMKYKRAVCQTKTVLASQSTLFGPFLRLNLDF